MSAGGRSDPATRLFSSARDRVLLGPALDAACPSAKRIDRIAESLQQLRDRRGLHTDLAVEDVRTLLGEIARSLEELHRVGAARSGIVPRGVVVSRAAVDDVRSF